MKFTIDPTKFLIDTIHMATDEIGAYVLLMVAQAARGKPASEHDLIYLTRWANEHADLAPVLAMFQEKDGHWSHPDIEAQFAERERFQKRSASANAARHRKVEAAPPILKREPDEPEPSLLEKVFDGTATEEEQRTVAEAAAEQPWDAGAKAVESLGTALPSDFALSGTMISEAKVKGVDDMELLADIFDDFKLYHVNAGTMSPDWHASWDKWFERKRPKKPRGAPRVQINNKATDDE